MQYIVSNHNTLKYIWANKKNPSQKTCSDLKHQSTS